MREPLGAGLQEQDTIFPDKAVKTDRYRCCFWLTISLQLIATEPQLPISNKCFIHNPAPIAIYLKSASPSLQKPYSPVDYLRDYG